MEATHNLKFPYIMAAQAQKHVTLNEALRMLDALVHISVRSSNTNLPDEPVEKGHAYIVSVNGAGPFEGHNNELAVFQDEGWAFYQPVSGWLAWVEDTSHLTIYHEGAWQQIEGTGGNGGPISTDLVGINATADTQNRLSLASPATLLNHENGDHRLKINKDTAAKTASAIFQTGFSGRAEMGTKGDDDFHIAVSADGQNWQDAIVIDHNSGSVSFPAGTVNSGGGGQFCGQNLLINGDFTINQREFAGGTLSDSSYGHDRMKAIGGNANFNVVNGTVTHTTGTLSQIVESPGLAGEAVTFSVEDLVGGDLDISVAGQTATIEAGPGRRHAVITIPVNAAGNIDTRWSPSNNAVSYRRMQLERGSGAHDWNPRPWGSELAICQRYFQTMVIPNGAVLATGHMITSTMGRINLSLPVSLRRNPDLGVPSFGPFRVYSNGVFSLNGMSVLGTTSTGVGIDLNINGNGTIYNLVSFVGLAGSYIQLDAEL